MCAKTSTRKRLSEIVNILRKSNFIFLSTQSHFQSIVKDVKAFVQLFLKKGQTRHKKGKIL